jgi:trigger factor
VQSAVESVSPTKVKLTVEVPFAELEPSLASAYKKLGSQVKIPGFRPGKVPPGIIDQRIGRGTVLEEAVNEAIPHFYGQAVEDNAVRILGRPDIDVTEFTDGEKLTFTAEVEVRPEVTLPDFASIKVSVEDAVASDAEIDEQIATMRDRFAVLQGANRPAQTGDFVSIDLVATVDGEPVEGASATGLSYEVGTDGLVPGIDDQLVGMSEGDSRTFATKLVAGEHADQVADVTVTVKTVKTKRLPELDDEFATTASEFDTLDELRTDIRERIERVKRLQQGVEARDKALEALLAAVELPLPEGFVATEVQWREQSIQSQLDQYGITRDAYLESEGTTEEQLTEEIRSGATEAVKAQLVLDAVADAEEIGVAQDELMDQIVRRAQRSGVTPDAYAQHMVEHGHLPDLVAEVRRGKALAHVLEAASVTDASGNPVDLGKLAEDAGAGV